MKAKHYSPKRFFRDVLPSYLDRYFSGKGLRELHVPVPLIELQREFAEQAAQVQSIQTQQSDITAKAQAAFDALLARCFSVAAADPCQDAGRA